MAASCVDSFAAPCSVRSSMGVLLLIFLLPSSVVATTAFAPSFVPTTTGKAAAASLASVVVTTRREPVATEILRMVPPSAAASGRSREDDIRRKIMKLKKEGRIKNKKEKDDDDESGNGGSSSDATLEKLKRQRQSMRENPAADTYADKISSKLGTKKAKVIGGAVYTAGDPASKGDEEEDDEMPVAKRGRLGALDASETEVDDDDDDDDEYEETEVRQQTERLTVSAPDDASPEEINAIRRAVAAAAGDGEEDGDDETSEEDLIDLVARTLADKSAATKLEGVGGDAVDLAVEREEAEAARRSPLTDDPVAKALKYKQQQQQQQQRSQSSKTTTGVGGSWAPPEEEKEVKDTYKPKSGSWGAFPRPRNISTAYGGGRKVGAGVQVDEGARQQSVEDTRAKLQAYRERVGIDVQSEKDHAAEIDEALELAGRAMQRGVYSTAVSCLEKVTKYCSTNSKVGGKVFLELAMAYEAVGRTDEAITVYTTLSTCRIEEIKFNAKRLLYGIEAMNFMRNEAKIKDFSRKKVRDTFIDTTGLKNIAQNFDKVYNTAYIDLDRGGNFYRQLTESVVRTNREARQILLKATGSGEVDRLKVVQALRSMSRHFDDALEEEIKQAVPEDIPVDYAGNPILRQKAKEADLSTAIGIDQFVLASPADMMENLDGEWRLQLMADRRGDGVRYYNSTLSWQVVDTSSMQFQSSEPAGFSTVSQSGNINFNRERRIITRSDISSSGNWISAITGGSSGALKASKQPQQIVSVDSVLLILRKISSSVDDEKDYFSVWRRVEPGKYSQVVKP